MNQPEQTQGTFLPDFCGTRTVFIVILIAELLAIVLTLAQPPFVSNYWIDLAMFSLFIQWVALSCTAILCIFKQHFPGLADHWVGIIAYFITLSTSLLVTELAWWIQSQWPAPDGYFRYGHITFLLRIMGISAVVWALTIRYFYVQHQWQKQARSEAEARFQALQSRIKPHFLFNCLNTIASLVRSDPKLAEESIEDLADLFRISLHDVRQASSLQDEINFCNRYLRIEQHRLGDRLNIDIQIDDVSPDIKLPVLSLQPLVENAIYHGIEPLPRGGLIRLHAARDDGFLRITIENPVNPVPSKYGGRAGNRIAQENVRQRLNAFFRREDLLEVRQTDQLYQVTVSIPLAHENSDR